MANPEVTRAVQQALDAAWDGDLPIDPRKIADGLVVSDGREYYPIFLDANPTLAYSGEAFFDAENARFVCRYKASEYPARSNFTVAHELGHIVLGHVNQGMRPRRDTSVQVYNRDPIEVDANQFAAELLMPAELVQTAVERFASLETISGIFDVSTTSMHFRLKNLGLLEFDAYQKEFA